MATYTEIGQHSQQDVSSSVIMDHGSISFGRFAAEPLAWEKWSVFRHDRCKEELEMYKSNGLVAQKKAYFEEYYKRVRAVKGLQSEHQETGQVGACTDVGISCVQVGNGSFSNDVSKEEKSASDKVDESGQDNKESLSDWNGCSDTVRDDTGNTLSDVVDQEQSSHQASVSATHPLAVRAVVTKHDIHVSDFVKLNANEQKKLAPVSKAKGNAASARNKSKLVCTSSKDAVKASVKSKPLPLSQITGKRNNILLPSKSNSPVASGKNSSQVSSRNKLSEVCSSAAVLRPSLTKIRMVPSSPSDTRNVNTNSKDLTDSLRRSQPVHARAVQNRSREMSLTGGMKDKALEKRTCPGVSRKPSELSCQQMQPKVCQSENQRPNYMLPNTARNRLIRDIEAECGRKNYAKERKEKEGGEGINNTCRRDPKSSNNPASTLQKKLKPVHKRKEEISTICRRDSKPVSTAPSIVEQNSKPFYKTAESWSGGLKHTLKGTKV